MFISVCMGKIHRATVTEANLSYEGSLTIDMDLVDKAGLCPYQEVSVVNVNNGARFETYIIEGARGSGVICLNGAAARLGVPGDKIIIMGFALVEKDLLPKDFRPKIVLVDEANREKKSI